MLSFICVISRLTLVFTLDNNMVQDNAIEKFNTTYTTYSSIGSKEEETKYEEAL